MGAYGPETYRATVEILSYRQIVPGPAQAPGQDGGNDKSGDGGSEMGTLRSRVGAGRGLSEDQENEAKIRSTRAIANC